MANCVVCNSFKRPINKSKFDFTHTKLKLSWNDLESSSNDCFCCHILRKGCSGLMAEHGFGAADVLDLDLVFSYKMPGDEERYSKQLVNLRLKSGREFGVEMFTVRGW
jgi:hypothetical protein